MRDTRNIRAWDDVAKHMSYGKIVQYDDMLGYRFDHFETETPIYMWSTGLKDRNGKEIYEGDVVRIRRPGRDTQTHYGDNIPLGSYTEPMEPVVTEEVVSIIFADGCFGYIQTADKPHYTVDVSEVIPLTWPFYESSATDENELKELFSGNWGHRILEEWEEDKQYLFETYKVSSIEELLNYIGVEVIGNIHQHPHLLGGNQG
jgi:hypothetical protein